ncbi:MAG: hypothetical protein ABSF59_07045 [Candidatus Sulfotelmatobacter sp.]
MHLSSAFNRITEVPVALPITSRGNFARMADFAVSLTEGGTKTAGLFDATSPALSIRNHECRAGESFADFRVSGIE